MKAVPQIDETRYTANQQRLREIAELKLGTFSDQEILEILDERRDLTKENESFEVEKKKENERRHQLEQTRSEIEKEIAVLNESISPDKADEELLALVKKRKSFEDELASLDQELSGQTETAKADPAEIPENTPAGEKSSETILAEKPVKKEEEVKLSEKTVEKEEKKEEEKKGKLISKEKAADDRFGGEKIDTTDLSPEANDFLKLLEANPEEALSRLEELPEDLRKNKSFMLKVAAVDPAYAMHYAHPKTLKMDEDFNVRIASMNNPRNSGNPLAEMLSEARTPKVILAAVKNDFRNLRYAMPSMPGYAEMIEAAKKQALEKVKSLGQAADIRMLIPKVLREDKGFMEQVEGVMRGFEEKKGKE